MSEILVYCRSGYEVDAANELTAVANERGYFGYPVFNAGDGYVHFNFYEQSHALSFSESISVAELIFARQLIVVLQRLTLEDKSDRVQPVISAMELANLKGIAGQVWVEFADTENGKALAKFCRKFNVPLRQHMRKAKLLTQKEREDKRNFHLFFNDFEHAVLGYSLPYKRSPFINGICRLKFPSDAPSRSTLKLEEAILTQLTSEQVNDIFRDGARAVDLGACPGGWTYQLTSRNMYVEAVDNGKMADNLMATGLVDYHAADGFKYQPQFGQVTLLVCDMIEQPDRVAQLMADWLCKGWAKHAIFNLKLPMKRRYESVFLAKQEIISRMKKVKIDFSMSIRHLYHDRDEVTVAVIRNS